LSSFEFFDYKFKSLQELCVVIFFKYIIKTHSMKTLESNSKNTYWKVLVNFDLPKSTQMAFFINNDIFNKNFNLHFDHTTCGKVLSNKWFNNPRSMSPFTII
jgi:hypothetical protein